MPKLYDVNRFRKSYPLIKVKPIYKQFLLSSEITGTGDVNVEVDTVDFNNSFQEIYQFRENYSVIPVIALTPEDDNVNVFITELTIEYVRIESSNNFTGKVHIQVFDAS
tara:strand:+ start:586 stop:912 length:327 start_codon:yes stop_codon:yes gene_type:complete